MLLSLSESLPSLVGAKFGTARATSGLLFSPTEVAIIRTSRGVPFQLRYCPTLAKKPVPKQIDATPKQKINPFNNPSPDLHIADIPTSDPTHLLVLNKFPIIAEHFILATKPNKRQTNALEQDDLEATYACLKAWQDGSGDEQKRLFAFFNSGEHSGASQPHRHLQFLPFENMCSRDEATRPWDLLIDHVLSKSRAEAKDEILQLPDLPFAHFARLFTSEPSGSELLSIYNELYSLAKDVVDKFIVTNPEQLALHSTDGGDLPISYNLAMTTTGMMVVPRRAEGTMLYDSDKEVGFVALNGTTLGGTMMVKHHEQWDLLRQRPEMLDSVLTAIGIPKETSWSKAHV